MKRTSVRFFIYDHGDLIYPERTFKMPASSIQTSVYVIIKIKQLFNRCFQTF